VLLKSYGWLYLERIKWNLEKLLSAAGAAKTQHPSPEESALHDLGTLWACTVEKVEKDINHVQIGIFSDIPQEDTKFEYVNVPFTLSFKHFNSQIAAMGIIRYLTTLHHTDLAKTLFLADSTVYHHPYPTAIDPSDADYPAEIYPLIRDYEAPGNGWFSHLVPHGSHGMLNVQHDWRAINNEEGWQSLLRVLKATGQRVFMRHKSVEDRMEFIRQHREREELEIAKTGGHHTNMFLTRHRDELWPSANVEGRNSCEFWGEIVADIVVAPVVPDQSISGEEWTRRLRDKERRNGAVFEDEKAFFAQL
jgi:hypothetical protein